MAKYSFIPVLWIFSLVPGFPINPTLSDMADNSFKELSHAGNIAYDYADCQILSFAGMVYDERRHKILAFGGGHATAVFPNSVVEFDFSILGWNRIINNVNCITAYTRENALLNSGYKKLGGFRYDGNIYAGSRHTYDGLAMAADTSIMLCMQAQEFPGCNGWDVNEYSSYYRDGNGLFTLDPVAKKWSVGDSVNIAQQYSYAEVNPNEPDLVYVGSAYYGNFQAVNWKTGHIFPKSTVRFGASSDMTITYYPERNSFLAFPRSQIWEYSITANRWTQLNPTGTIPDCYSLNVAYDNLNKVFCCFYNNDFYYFSPIETKWYKMGDSLPITRLFHHHIYDPIDNVHVMAGTGSGPSWHNYAYKFSDTPGKFPGTGLGSAIEERATPFAENALSIDASPNPFSAKTTMRMNRAMKNGFNLCIYNIKGERLSDLTESVRNRSVSWSPAGLPSGVYVARLSAGGRVSQAILVHSK